MRRWPVGVAVATVEVRGTRLGLTVSSLVSLALEPPLVGISVARQAAFHELLREAGGFAASLLAGDQVALASTSRAACRRSRCGPGSTSPRARAGRSSTAPSAGSSAARGRARGRRPHLLLAQVERAEGGAACSGSAATTGAHDRGGRLRPRRRRRRLGAGLGRRPRAARARARPLARGRAGGDDGDELARVVGVHARRDRPPSRRRRSTPRSSAGCSSATASSCR